MIEAEQFIYGHGIGLVKTDGVTQLLTKESIQYLCTLEKDSQSLLGDVVAVTFVTNGHDMYGRDTVLNHTILVKVEDYFRLHPPTLFAPYRIFEKQDSLSRLRIEAK